MNPQINGLESINPKIKQKTFESTHDYFHGSLNTQLIEAEPLSYPPLFLNLTFPSSEIQTTKEHSSLLVEKMSWNIRK